MNTEAVPKRGWGPFTGRQLTVIACVAVIALVVMIPTAAMAASGLFTSTTTAPAITATNSSGAAGAVGALGRSNATGNVARTGVLGSATGANGVGVQGNGARYGVYSNGPLGVAAGKRIVCTACITTADYANRITVPFSLAGGANSAVITLPANIPISVTGVTTTVGVRGVASASLLRASGGENFIEWTGLESTTVGGGSAITQGLSSGAGAHILYIDWGHQVDVQVNDATSVRIHNGTGAVMAGNVVFTW